MKRIPRLKQQLRTGGQRRGGKCETMMSLWTDHALKLRGRNGHQIRSYVYGGLSACDGVYAVFSRLTLMRSAFTWARSY